MSRKRSVSHETITSPKKLKSRSITAKILRKDNKVYPLASNKTREERVFNKLSSLKHTQSQRMQSKHGHHKGSSAPTLVNKDNIFKERKNVYLTKIVPQSPKIYGSPTINNIHNHNNLYKHKSSNHSNNNHYRSLSNLSLDSDINNNAIHLDTFNDDEYTIEGMDKLNNIGIKSNTPEYMLAQYMNLLHKQTRHYTFRLIKTVNNINKKRHKKVMNSIKDIKNRIENININNINSINMDTGIERNNSNDIDLSNESHSDAGSMVVNKGINEINTSIEPIIDDETVTDDTKNDDDNKTFNDIMIDDIMMENSEYKDISNNETDYDNMGLKSINLRNVYGIGNNEYGLFGLNHTNNMDKLTKLQFNVIKSSDISLSNYNIFIQNSDEYGLFGAGLNDMNQISKNSGNIINTMHDISTFDSDKIVLVSHGLSSKHTIIITENNKTYGFGKNDSGQLGINKVSKNEISPVRLWLNRSSIKDKIIDIKCGKKHSIFLSEYGSGYSAGNNEFGQLGLGDFVIDTPELMLITRIHSWTKIAKIYCTEYNSYFITKSGTFVSCGYNYLGLLGMNIQDPKQINYEPATVTYFKQYNIKCSDVKCGMNHVIALSTEGAVYTFGDNKYNQCGIKNIHDDITYLNIPHKLGLTTKLLNKRNKTSNNDDTTYNDLNITQISAGSHHSILMDHDKNIFTFGKNHNNECLAKRKKYGKIIEEPIKISLKALSNNVSIKKLERIIGGNEATFITFK